MSRWCQILALTRIDNGNKEIVFGYFSVNLNVLYHKWTGHLKHISLHCKQDSSWSLNSSVYWRLNAWMHNMLSWTFIRLSWQCNISLCEGLRGNCWVSVSLQHWNHAALCRLAVVKWQVTQYRLRLPINIEIPYLQFGKFEIKIAWETEMFCLHKGTQQQCLHE